jgi:hypothetical protein
MQYSGNVQCQMLIQSPCHQPGSRKQAEFIKQLASAAAVAVTFEAGSSDKVELAVSGCVPLILQMVTAEVFNSPEVIYEALMQKIASTV